jgi:hypothetical protein
MQAFFVGLFALLIGAAFCFAGLRFFLFLMPIWGFFAGFEAGAAATSALFGQHFLATVTGWVIGIVIGLIFAALAYLYYWCAVGLLGSSLGYTIGAGLVTWIGLPGFIAFIVGVVCALAMLVAVIALDVPTKLIIALTALGGAGTIVAGLLLLFQRIPLDAFDQGAVAAMVRDSWFWLIVWALIAAGGLAAQTAGAREATINRAAYQY